VEICPCLSGHRIAVGSFGQVAVGIEFPAVEAVDNQMWPASGSFVQGTRQGAAQFLCIESFTVEHPLQLRSGMAAGERSPPCGAERMTGIFPATYSV